MVKEIDYVKLYAEKLKRDKNLFAQQRMLINSQIIASRELFRNAFGKGEEFKKNARRFLKSTGRI